MLKSRPTTNLSAVPASMYFHIFLKKNSGKIASLEITLSVRSSEMYFSHLKCNGMLLYKKAQNEDCNRS